MRLNLAVIVQSFAIEVMKWMKQTALIRLPDGQDKTVKHDSLKECKDKPAPGASSGSKKRDGCDESEEDVQGQATKRGRTDSDTEES